MSIGVVDPLKIKTYGDKKDPEIKRKLYENSPQKQGKQYYPVNVKQKQVDEWQAVLKGQNQVVVKQDGDRLGQIRQNKERLGRELDVLAQEHDVMKRELLHEKKSEHDRITKDMSNYEHARILMKDYTKQQQNSLANEYAQNVYQKKEFEKQKKMAELREDQVKIKKIQEQLMEEKVQKIQEKRVLAQEKAEELRDKEKRKMQDFQRKKLYVEEHKQNLNEYEESELKREDNYQRYFQRWGEGMQKRQKDYISSLVSPERIQGEKILFNRSFDANNNRHTNRFDNMLGNHLWNPIDSEKRKRGLLPERDYGYQDRAHVNEKITIQNQAYLQQIKDTRKQEQEKYRKDLQEQTNLKKGMGTMTAVEKKFNKGDLANYKLRKNAAPSSMIPGIFNLASIGSRPTCRGAGAEIVGVSAMNQSHSLQTLDPYSRKETRSVMDHKTYEKKEFTKPLQMHSPLSGVGPDILSPSKYHSNQNKLLNVFSGSGYQNFGAIRSPEPTRYNPFGYNPITNPIPGYQQNPYFSRIQKP